MPHDAYAHAPAPLPWRKTRENAYTGSAIAAVQSMRNTASLIPGNAVRSITGNTVASKNPIAPNATPASAPKITDSAPSTGCGGSSAQ